RFGSHMADAQSGGRTREAAVGDEAHVVTDPLTHERRRHGEHLAHAGAALGTLVANNHAIAGLDLLAFDGMEAVFLAIEHARGSLELELLETRHLDYAALLGEVA